MTTILTGRSRTRALTAVFLISFCGHAIADGPQATRILTAADHAELAVEVAADAVVRVALLGDRIERVIRAPGGFAAEHDPESGDLYLRPLPAGAAQSGPVALFVGSERGFTYRLTLTPAEHGPAQILIRNGDSAGPPEAKGVPGEGGRIGAIARLIRAVANRVPLPGYAIEAAGDASHDAGPAVLEVWRGPRFSAWVLKLASDDGAKAPADAVSLAVESGPGVAAVWIARPAASSSDTGRFAVSPVAVIVREEPAR